MYLKFLTALFLSILLSGCTLLKKDTKATPPTQEVSLLPVIEKKSEVKTEITDESNEDKETNEKSENKISKKQTYTVYNNLNGAIVNIAEQLLESKTIPDMNNKVILTSFVDIDSFQETSSFGRILSESMFNELHTRNFKIIDFRGQDAVTVTEDGEFHITRDVEKLKDEIQLAQFIVVGTYGKFEFKSIMLNARILEATSGEVISSARVIYKPQNCKTFELCEKTEPTFKIIKRVVESGKKEDERIQIIQDN